MRKHLVVPSANNVRTYRRLALFGGVVAFVAFVAGIATFGGGRGGGYARSPLSMFVLGVGLVAAAVAWRSTAERLQQQMRQLASYGRRYAVERVGSAAMQRGFGAGWRVVVAQWRDAHGVAREALSEAFDYDPAPLLDATRVQVVADPFHPELCMVAGDTLPRRAPRAGRAACADAVRLAIGAGLDSGHPRDADVGDARLDAGLSLGCG